MLSSSIKRNGASLVTYAYEGRQVTRRSVLSEYRARATFTTSRDVYIDYRMAYDSHRRMTKIRNSARYTADPADQGSSLGQYEYTYDEAGNRLTHIASQFARPRQVGYVYDDLNRVSQAQYLIGSGTPTPATTTYAYDLLGNRNEVLDELNKKTWTYGANTAANEYTTTSVAITKPNLTVDTYAQTVLYDPRGNLVADEGFEPVDDDQFVYEYDIENRLTKVTYDDGTNPAADVADYRYDAIGRRIEYVDHVRYNPDTQSPGVTIRYFHDGHTLDSPAGLGPGAFGTHAWRAPACQGQNVVEEYDGDDTQPLRQRGYINGAQYIDERVVMRLYDVEAHDHYYIHQELYTVTGLVARNGLFEEAYQYDAYGQATIYQWPFGDVNWDGQTASGDITIVKARSGQANADPWADLNMDGAVASGDITLVKAHSGETLDEINYSSLDNPFFFTGRLTDTLHASAYEIDIPWICFYPECEDPVEGVDYDALARRLQDNRNRTYDSRHGRWLQRDPAEYADSTNLYEYVRSRPSTYLDPSGEFLQGALCVVCVGVVGTVMHNVADLCYLSRPISPTFKEFKDCAEAYYTGLTSNAGIYVTGWGSCCCCFKLVLQR
jgi:RHS repeat-associated protein